MKRKKSFLLLSILLLLSACSTGGKQLENHNSENAVVISIPDEPTSLDPCQGWGHGSTPLVQSTLVSYQQDTMEFVNDIATNYTLSEDGLIWTFQIRNDVKFTDGEPLTASDVAFTFRTAQTSQSSLDLTFLENVEAPDDTTVIFTMNRPMSSFLYIAAAVGIVPEHAYQKETYGTQPIGSGPYQFVQWNPQEQIILEANPDYYGKRPAIQKVTLIFQEEDAAFAAVQSGQADVACISAALAATPVKGYHLQAITTVDNRGLTLPLSPAEGKVTESGYPYGNAITYHKEIRQAMAYAIDRKQIAQDALNGFGTPCYSVNDGFPWNNPACVIETDIAYAKKLLSDNGWTDTNGDGVVDKNGQEAAFTCIYPSGDSVRQAVAMATAAQLEQIGISMTVEGTSWDDIEKRMFSDVVCMGWGAVNPYESYCLFHSDSIRKDDYYNPEGYSNPVVDNYLETALAALTIEEANENWRLSQWDGQTGTAMQGDCPWLWLVNVQHLYYVRDGLDIGQQQFHPHGSSMPLIQNVKDWTWSA